MRFFVAFQLDHNAHAFAGRFVANIGNTFDLFRLHEFGDPFDQARFVNLIRNLGDDNVLAVLAGLFNRGLRAHGEAAAARPVGGFNAFTACNVCTGRKIRAGNNF